MSFKRFFLFSFFLLFYCGNAFNITRLLSQYPSFSTFNNYLSQTQLASQINSRQTITVLVVENSALSPISGRPANVLKNILSVHIVLDYYDVQKLQKLPNKTEILTTLFQSSGQATGQQGFLNVTDLSTGSIVIGSAVKGATLGANLVKSVAAQPYNISVLQISNVIIPTGIDNSTSHSPSMAPSPASTSPTPSVTPVITPPAPSPSNATAPSPSNATAPTMADTPSPANAPATPPRPDTPAADAPTADAPAADAPPNDSSSGGTLRLGVGVVLTILSFIII
ncbi:hypothetical protein RJ639_010529 [Escallonia herrerae]|uniref:FAS1 domain-containing protein n=1 Tax=Escallonia herrerae TaxID=1293975 RepID=A0AA88VQF8_9ASTE|nr:hypothetical protein RJ639_010529 [Escallonia herrerae]